MKSWRELTADEKMLAKSLPLSAKYTPAERKRHRFCTRCWVESTPDQPVNA